MRGRAARAAFSGVILAMAAAAGSAQQATPPPPPTPPASSPPATSGVAPVRTVVPRPEGAPLASDSAVVVGQVVDGHGRALPRAVVHLIGESIQDAVIADDKGRFLFTQIPPGEAIVIVQKPGYSDGAYGKRRPGGVPLPVSLHAGEGIADMRIEMFRSAAITGLVTDDSGDPLIGVRVVAMRRMFDNGRWRYVPAGVEETDDQGFYRIFDLVPGEYIVSVPAASYSAPMAALDMTAHDIRISAGLSRLAGTLPGREDGQPLAAGQTMRVTTDGRDLIWSAAIVPPDADDQDIGYVTQFYPATERQLLALPIVLGAGEVRYAVDFRMTPVPVYSVSGRLTGDPAAVANQFVRLVPAFDSDRTDDAAATVTRDDGTFSFRRVPPGDYRLEAGSDPTVQEPADASPGTAVGFWAQAEVKVGDADVTVPDIEMHPEVSLSGFVFGEPDADGKLPDISALRIPVTITPAGPGLSGARQLTANHEFNLQNLIPGRYYVQAGALPAGWFVKSIEAAGQNALDDPVEVFDGSDPVVVTITTHATEILGTVRDARAVPAAGATVIIMPIAPTGESVWTPNRIRETRSSTAGVFTVKGLPPGQYLAVAIDDAVAENWQDERVVATLRTLAVRFELQPGESKSLNLRQSVLRR
ncbi:MAG TPA: carboxypeptidase-like regulatory domain-containing protein [Vicinamibacterales bacterium]|nr:carboxypeptidase-like regulatory domain-containing protein [Vicinamibacterales bacterium]